MTPGGGWDTEITVPAELLAAADAVRGADESFADLVRSALEHEIRRRRGLRTYDALLRLQAAPRAVPAAPRPRGDGVRLRPR